MYAAIAVLILGALSAHATQVGSDKAINQKDEVLTQGKLQLRSGHLTNTIAYLSEGNVHDQLGIKPDAKFVAYNGHELTTKEEMEKALEDSKKIGRHTLQIEQDGRLRTLKYDVRK